jgi:hypothetical protein
MASGKLAKQQFRPDGSKKLRRVHGVFRAF